MANHKSAEKRSRQNKKKRATNRWKTSRVRTEIKKLKVALNENNLETAKTLMVSAQSLLDKLAKSPAMKKNTASRLVSRLAQKVSSATKA